MNKYIYINTASGDDDKWTLIGSGQLTDEQTHVIIKAALDRRYGMGQWEETPEGYYPKAMKTEYPLIQIDVE